MQHRLSPYHIGSIILVVALVIVIASVGYTTHLARQLSEQEQLKMQQWAEATSRLIQADEMTDISFYQSIIEQNTTIPVYMLDDENNILQTRNVKKVIDDPTSLHGPIELHISDEIVQYIYYDESLLLKQLHYFPYIEFGIILLFVLIAVVSLYLAQQSEQNRVWAGLSKETAHQLGTPISSLNGWQELLQMRYPNDELIPQMQQDIHRLQTIAERFSKVGSAPVLSPTALEPIIQGTITYMRTRISNKVQIVYMPVENVSPVRLNAPLFSWVLENLIKNAVDAMNGTGQITLVLTQEENKIHLDITDTGHGIDRSSQRAIFQPGYTSKSRGWGLGLSLSKRIVEDYHGGKIFVKSSEVGVSTTFRITLMAASIVK